MKAQRISPSENRLHVARRRFERIREQSPRELKEVRFEDALKAFDTSPSLAEAGRRLGIDSRQEASRLYRDVFAELFPWSDGRQRRGERTREIRNAENRRRASVLPASPLPRAVAIAARMEGLEVLQVPVKGEAVGQFKNRVLRIENSSCVLYSSSSLFRAPTGTRYSRVNTRRNVLERHDMAIIHQTVEGFPHRFFIIPCKTLIASWSHKRWLPRTSSNLHLYLPLDGSSLKPKVDFHQYIDAWDQLRSR